MVRVPRDPWLGLAQRTPARIALGHTGVSLPTQEVLAFQLALARARDAVHKLSNTAALRASLEALELEVLEVESLAADRNLYLLRPDQGRRLSPAGKQVLQERAGDPPDLVVVIGDGLSAAAVDAQAPGFVRCFLPYVSRWKLAPFVLARGARVALGDEIGEILRARAVAMLIGERPGLSAPDSLGVYLTFAPKRGRKDAERNCISNIRPAGLSCELAAFKLAWLFTEALRRAVTGVDLKDESDHLLGEREPRPGLLEYRP
jgi:ethanolamine ammonia-lyase small subunit